MKANVIVDKLKEESEKDLTVLLRAKSKKQTVEPVEIVTSTRLEKRTKLEIALAHNRPVVIELADMVVKGNVREEVDVNGKDFRNLVNSIKENGLEQSLLLAYKSVGESDYELIVACGQRRKLALEELGVEKAPCLLKRYTTDVAMISWGLEENLNRKDLHFLDLGKAYADLNTAGLSQMEIAMRWEDVTGHGTNMISRAITSSKFPEHVKRKIRDNPRIFKVSVICNQLAANRGTKYADDMDLEAAVNDLIRGAGRVIPQTDKKSIDQVETAMNLPAGWLKGKAKGDRSSGRVLIKWKSKTEFEELLRILNGPKSQS